jgi:hypothetical protein
MKADWEFFRRSALSPTRCGAATANQRVAVNVLRLGLCHPLDDKYPSFALGGRQTVCHLLGDNGVVGEGGV